MSDYCPVPLQTPRSMTLSVTGRCNLKCKYCFYANEMVALQDLPTAVWLKLFEEMNSLGVMRVTLSGGEVFTRPDVFELIDGIVANRMRYGMLTNGTLITEKVIEQFAVGKRLTRLNSIQVSIDGSSAEIHDSSRPNSFARAMRGLKLLREAEFPLTVRVTLNKHNVGDLENIAALLLDEIGLPSFSTNNAMPLGAGCDNQGDIALNGVEKLQAMEIFDRLLQRYPGRLIAMSGPQASMKRYRAMEHARSTGEMSQSWKMGYLSACGCTFASLDVLHDGSIVPCHLLPHQVLGNIQTDSIKDIWHDHPILNNMRGRYLIPMSSVPGCTECGWNTVCNGGCPALPYELTGDLNRANPDHCYQKFIDELETFHVPFH